jgi:hypothetical protein
LVRQSRVAGARIFELPLDDETVAIHVILENKRSEFTISVHLGGGHFELLFKATSDELHTSEKSTVSQIHFSTKIATLK